MTYKLNENIATLTFDDGKANVVGHSFLDEINAGLDRAEKDGAGAIILCGREGMFSAGFDLKEFQKGPEAALAMVSRGFELLIRLYSFPRPLVAACTGHGVAMGAFIIMACDMRIGTRGDFKLRLPETAISMELPPILLELTKSRIAPAHLTRVALLSEPYTPDDAVTAGFLDKVVAAGELESHCQAIALQLAQLPRQQFATNKLAIRAETLQTMRDSLAAMTKR